MKTVEFHRVDREWLQVRCPCGHWTKEPVEAWKARSRRAGFEYGCNGERLHHVSESEADRLRSLLEHPGWD